MSHFNAFKANLLSLTFISTVGAYVERICNSDGGKIILPRLYAVLKFVFNTFGKQAFKIQEGEERTNSCPQ